jgi:hypothetical protein
LEAASADFDHLKERATGISADYPAIDSSTTAVAYA